LRGYNVIESKGGLRPPDEVTTRITIIEKVKGDRKKEGALPPDEFMVSLTIIESM
jgi:hypothetical protein